MLLFTGFARGALPSLNVQAVETAFWGSTASSKDMAEWKASGAEIGTRVWWQEDVSCTYDCSTELIRSSTMNFWTTRPELLKINKPYKTWEISDHVGQSNSAPWLMLSLQCVLIAYYKLQTIIFGDRIPNHFSYRNSIRQQAQSAVKIHIQRKPGNVQSSWTL